MKIAVVLVNYNGLSDTLDCIDSLYKSTVPLKVIVIDNASKDDETYFVSQKYPDVKVFRQEENLGFAGGNNIGIRWALDNGYEYIALLNNDTVIDSTLFKFIAIITIVNDSGFNSLFFFHQAITFQIYIINNQICFRT